MFAKEIEKDEVSRRTIFLSQRPNEQDNSKSVLSRLGNAYTKKVQSKAIKQPTNKRKIKRKGEIKWVYLMAKRENLHLQITRKWRKVAVWMSLSALALLCLLKFLKKLNLDKLFARIYFNFPSLFSTI